MEENECNGCEDCKESKEELYLNELKSLQADFINLKNRVDKEKIQLKESITNDVLKKFLEVKDNFDRAPKLDDGMKLIYNQFNKIFQENGVEEINEDSFNAEVHEAIAVNKELDKNKIQVVEKGYKRNNVVIKPAKVIIGTKE